MTRQSAWIPLFVIVACSAQPSPRVLHSEITFVEAAYRRAWLADESWTLRISSSGDVEERIYRRSGELVHRRRGRIAATHLADLRRILDEVSFETLPSRLKRAVDDAPTVTLRVNRDGKLWEVVAEAPWDQVCKGDFARFAKAWNEVLGLVPPSRGCGGGGECTLCGAAGPTAGSLPLEVV